MRSIKLNWSCIFNLISFNSNDQRFKGGQFLDGRANTLDEQALDPFLNTLELNSSRQGDCRRCHELTDNQSQFTDFSYRNMDVPRNINNPFLLHIICIMKLHTLFIA
ncbi:MAG: hypothetical protein ISR69_14475 [Gammaproteobacteria bacterium]|nr:hypothetical protein [Gammaproteobacteria bacterium]